MDGINGFGVRGKDAVLVSLGEIGMQQPVKQVGRRLVEFPNQLAAGPVSLGHGHLGVPVAVDEAGSSRRHAQAEDEADGDDDKCPPKVNHLALAWSRLG